MSKSLRLSEKWFRRGLWVVAVVFAGFLVGLGSRVVDDLPHIEQSLSLDHFVDTAQMQPLQNKQQELAEIESQAEDAQEQALLQLKKARSQTQQFRDNFQAWIETRSATQRSEQNPEVIRRTQELEATRQLEHLAQQDYQKQQQVLLDTRQEAAKVEARISVLNAAAREQLHEAWRQQELRVFFYRLALTLPLLVIAGWLFAKQRKSTWWPFVWGFIFFALFTFFVELVPYLPSYGGYVRYAVGIVITVLVGRWAIVALQRYLERQKIAEALPVKERRNTMAYDAALTQLAKGVCPGCERPVDLKDGVTNYCPHCGIGLFGECTACHTRKSAFTKFCFSCGANDASLLQSQAQP